MALRYEWGFDIATIGNVSVKATDEGGAFVSEVTLTAGTFCHTDIGDKAAGYSAFAEALENELTSNSPAPVIWTVAYNGTTGYTVAAAGATCELDFNTSTPAEGVRMAQILGFSSGHGNASTSGTSFQLTTQTSYSSDVRPYYQLIPTIQGRSEVSDEYEPPDIAIDNEADDGTAYQVARDTSSIYVDWTQTYETNSPPASFSSDGCAVFKRSATSEVPWSYQHAWEHQRGGKQPIYVSDGSDLIVCEMRGEGCSFVPQRAGSKDFALWNIPFKTRLLGYIDGYVPSDDTDLTGWLRADRGIYHASNAISQWDDQESTRDVSQATAANKPTWVTSTVLNGQRAVRFDGTNDYIANTTMATISQPYTICVALSLNGLPGTYAAIVHGSASAMYFMFKDADTLALYAGTEMTADYTFAADTPYIITAVVNGASSSIRVNGAEIGTGNPNTTQVFDDLYIGADGASTQYYLDADIAELAITADAASGSDLTNLEDYMIRRYAPELL